MKASPKILIYDDGCPLCSAYTAGFVKAGMLDEAGRKNFNNIDPAIFALIDKQKCHNEIPLRDTQTTQVWYGIDALLEILNSKIPGIKSLGNIGPAKWFLREFYKFISYNRKVIVAHSSSSGYDCSPDFSSRYRAAFLFFFFFFNTIMLVPLYSTVFSNSFIGNSSLFQLQAAHLALAATNFISVWMLNKKQAFEYLGQLNMLALITILMIVPLHFINRFLEGEACTLNNIYLILLSLIVTWQYRRRMKYAGIILNHRRIVVVNMISLACFLIYLII